jgi:hypothetical protein
LMTGPKLDFGHLGGLQARLTGLGGEAAKV